ncbi:MAG: polysaccharide biosynthesis C-terminal domain-containing protein [Chloroflexi bacterium]|nr:polysaccharide biosynthesis C-terminal domain-containing protein [Chloroflexota bacterium]
MFAGLFLGMRRIGSVALQSLGYPGLSTLAESIGLGVLLVGLISLTLPFGIIGTAWALFLSGLTCLVAQLVILRVTAGQENNSEAVRPNDHEPAI